MCSEEVKTSETTLNRVSMILAGLTDALVVRHYVYLFILNFIACTDRTGSASFGGLRLLRRTTILKCGSFFEFVRTYLNASLSLFFILFFTSRDAFRCCQACGTAHGTYTYFHTGSLGCSPCHSAVFERRRSTEFRLGVKAGWVMTRVAM